MGCLFLDIGLLDNGVFKAPFCGRDDDIWTPTTVYAALADLDINLVDHRQSLDVVSQGVNA